MRPRRSTVWMYFDLIQNSTKAKCLICSNLICFSSGNVSNLSRHLKLKHPTVPLRPLDSRQGLESSVENPDDPPELITSSSVASSIPTQRSSVASSTLPQTRIYNYLRPTKAPEGLSKKVDKQLIKMVTKEYQPLSLVQDPEFKKFIELVSQCPGYKLPTRKTITEGLIPSQYESTRTEVKSKLGIASAVCLTTDSWTSCNTESFLAVTAHFIEGTELSSYLLDCVKFVDRHTSQNLANALMNIAKDYQIENKITAVVSDNASNITGAITINNWRQIPCFAHTLNLVVQDGLKNNIQGTLRKIKSIVEFFKRSTTGNAKLRATQVQLGLPELKLKQDVATRWNSTYDMINRILKLKDAVVTVIALLDTNLVPLTSAEWTIASQVVDILEIFNEVTVEVSAEKNVSLSKIIVYIKTIRNVLDTYLIDSSFHPQTKQIANDLKDGMTTRFAYLSELASECTLLDPRFKKAGFMGDEAKYKRAYDSVQTKLTAEFTRNPVPTSDPPTGPTHEEGSSVPKKSKMWNDFDKALERSMGQTNPTSASIVQLDRYIQEMPLGRHENPLVWWEERKKIYPGLYKIAKRRLCIVATSVPCERIFSKTGLIMNDRRNRLRASKLSQIVFLNHNWN
uniref:Zinc finger BED domain-containing protein 1 n=2 Tax=Cacopsylla melanoneura TaxID=428564 RepID=A0A8D8Z989_9HEMI